MNNKIVPVAVILLLLLVVGIGAAMMMKPTVIPVAENTSPVVSQIQPTNQPQPSGGTLKDLLSGGNAQECTYTTNSGDTTTNTTIYVANGKMRGDITTNTAGINTSSHMIVDSTYSYIWMENSTTGFKFPVNAQNSTTPSPNNQSIDLNQSVNYTCGNWTEDDSVFNLPAKVTFQTTAIPSVPVPTTPIPTGYFNQDYP